MGARHVIRQPDALLLAIRMGRREAQQFGNAFLVWPVFADAFLERAPKFLPETRVLFLLVLRQVLEQA